MVTTLTACLQVNPLTYYTVSVFFFQNTCIHHCSDFKMNYEKLLYIFPFSTKHLLSEIDNTDIHLAIFHN
jgi:hypothetical protein